MKKLLLLISIVIIASCSEDDNNEMITAEEYGVFIDGPDVDYNYKFYAEPNGEILKDGQRNGEQNILFDVSENEIKAENLHFELEPIDGSVDEIEAFLIARKNDLYLNNEDNPNATDVFEMNNTSKSDGKITGYIPVIKHRVFWVKNSEWSNN